MAENPQKFIENPFNSLFLIKSLSYDFNLIQEALNSTIKEFEDSTKDLKLPLTDFDGAIDGFLRIQETYELKSEDLVAGFIEGEKYHEKFSNDEIYALGMGLIKFDKNFAAEYLKIALNNSSGELKTKILDKLFEIYANSKKYEEALEVLAKKIALDTKNEELQKLQVHLELIALFNDEKKVKSDENSSKNFNFHLPGRKS